MSELVNETKRTILSKRKKPKPPLVLSRSSTSEYLLSNLETSDSFYGMRPHPKRERDETHNDHYRILDQLKQKVSSCDDLISKAREDRNIFQLQFLNHKKNLYIFMAKSFNRLLLDIEMQKELKQRNKLKKYTIKDFKPAIPQFDINSFTKKRFKNEKEEIKEFSFYVTTILDKLGNLSQDNQDLGNKQYKSIRERIDAIYRKFERRGNFKKLLKIELAKEARRGKDGLLERSPLKQKKEPERSTGVLLTQVDKPEARDKTVVDSIRKDQLFISKQFLSLCDQNILSRPIVTNAGTFATSQYSQLVDQKTRKKKWWHNLKKSKAESEINKEMKDLIRSQMFFDKSELQDRLKDPEKLKRLLMRLNNEETEKEIIKENFIHNRAGVTLEPREYVNHIRDDSLEGTKSKFVQLRSKNKREKDNLLKNEKIDKKKNLEFLLKKFCYFCNLILEKESERDQSIIQLFYDLDGIENDQDQEKIDYDDIINENIRRKLVTTLKAKEEFGYDIDSSVED